MSVSESAESELITIVEGPTPDFLVTLDPWSLSVLEGQSPYITAKCQVRSFNGQKLMDRCLRAWGQQRPIRLDFKQMDGLRRQVDIIAARMETIEQVDVLNLWVRQKVETLLRWNNNSSNSGDDSFPPGWNG